MPNIGIPMQIPGMNLKPPIPASQRLSDDMQQSLATLCGYATNHRVLLRASTSGVLAVTSPRIIDILHIAGSGANDHPLMTDLNCTELLIMGHPDNTGLIWVRPGVAATVNNAWPLASNDVVNFTVDNVNRMSLLVVVDGEKAIIAVAC